jgi:DNA-binding LacI/PurR family transcriptional regulator
MDEVREGHMSRGRVTTVDVAREAGVSRATVSLALNGDPSAPVAAATRQLVIQVSERLGYQPSAAARSLRGGKSRTVLLLSSAASGSNARMAALAENLAAELALQGFSLVWQLAIAGTARPVGELSPAAVLTASTLDDLEFDVLASGFSVPVLPLLPGRDEYLGAVATAQVNHLLGRGFTELVYAAPAELALSRISDLRSERFLHATRSAGALTPTTITWPAERRAGRAAVDELLALPSSRVGVCSFNDDVALAILGALHDRNVPVPARVAVIGADNAGAGQFSVPALTSVDADLRDFVRETVINLVSIIAGRGPSMILCLPTTHQVIQRSTT